MDTTIRLAVQEHPLLGEKIIAEPLVLIHGWGCDSRTWQPLLPQLQTFAHVITIDLPGFGQSDVLPEFTLDTVLAALLSEIPAHAIVVGWSLGGMLAVALAALAPEHISQVITLAANVKFVASADYPCAMPVAIQQQFSQSFTSAAQLTLKRFSGLLAQGDANERALLKMLRAQNVALETNDNWLQALALLSELDNRVNFSRLTQPGLHILGAADVLVPVAAAEALQQLNNNQKIIVLPDTAHALHWSQVTKVANTIESFLQEKLLDKRKVANSFSRAAATYDSVAKLQRAVGAHLLQHYLSELTSATPPLRILDMGCGTGFFSNTLTQQFTNAQIVGLDIAEGMLTFARAERAETIHWLCGDAENLPLQTGSVDLIFSSLAIQWCDNLPKLFAEIRRVLAPGGTFLFSTLGPATLRELKSAWQQVDHYVHVNHFCSAQHIQAALNAAGLQLNHWQSEDRILRYQRLVDLTRELKALGAHNINTGQQAGLTGRQKLTTLKLAYEKFRHEQCLPATYEVFYGSAS